MERLGRRTRAAEGGVGRRIGGQDGKGQVAEVASVVGGQVGQGSRRVARQLHGVAVEVVRLRRACRVVRLGARGAARAVVMRGVAPAGGRRVCVVRQGRGRGAARSLMLPRLLEAVRLYGGVAELPG